MWFCGWWLVWVSRRFDVSGVLFVVGARFRGSVVGRKPPRFIWPSFMPPVQSEAWRHDASPPPQVKVKGGLHGGQPLGSNLELPLGRQGRESELFGYLLSGMVQTSLFLGRIRYSSTRPTSGPQCLLITVPASLSRHRSHALPDALRRAAGCFTTRYWTPYLLTDHSPDIDGTRELQSQQATRDLPDCRIDSTVEKAH